MDKSNPRWVLVQTKGGKRSNNLEPLPFCSNQVSHTQLVHALKATCNNTEPRRTAQEKAPLTIPPIRSVMAPPYPYAGAPVRGRGRNNHHESRDTNDRILSALEQRKRALYTRQHDKWSLPVYGNFGDREEFMHTYRGFLKSQMDEKNWQKRVEFNTSLRRAKKSYEETRMAIEKDNAAVTMKKQKQQHFRDENKKMMEEKEALRRSLHKAEIEQERRLVKIDPINWSRTLR